MPGSFMNFDALVAELIGQLQPRSCLDIGCGSGKYGRMLRERAPQCRRIGLEVEPRYVQEFELDKLYDELRIGRAWEVLNRDQGEAFDLCMRIEHMPKSVGLDLLNFLSYRTAWTVVLAPEFCVQGSVNGVDAESHISVWSEHDFHWHDRWAWDSCFTICAFLLRGYQPCAMDFERLVDGLNAARPMIVDFHGARTLRPVALRKQLRLRVDSIDGQDYCFRPR